MEKKSYIGHFRGLELLRFALSLIVIIYHYQHFFYPFVPIAKSDVYHFDQPFYQVLGFFYNYGYYAVQVFWLISGIIFFKIYQQKINDNKVDFKSFAVNRFSRLYPLHFLMLMSVVALQFLFQSRYGNFFVYNNNGLKEFFQNLLFVQTWGHNKFSFNGPTWSVSIEILVYIVFFVIAKSGFLSSKKSLLLTIIFFVIVKKWQLVFLNDDLTTCFYFFFCGCGFIYLYEKVRDHTKVVIASILLMCIALYIVLHPPGSLGNILDKVTGYLDINLLLISMIAVVAFLFVFSHGIFDRINNKVFQFFGDMTYSTYLIHFPLQMIFFLLLKPANYQLFLDPKIFLLYMLTVIILGRLVFIYVEVPLQAWLRNKFQSK